MAVGQFFSQRFGYAVHAMCYMAKKPSGTLTTLPELAAWLQSIWSPASQTYVSNVIQRLARGGVLRSYRGVSGGYALAKPAEEISLRQLAELLEGIDAGRCSLSLEAECPRPGQCAIQRALSILEEGYLQSLAEVSIAKLAAELRIDGLDDGVRTEELVP